MITDYSKTCCPGTLAPGSLATLVLPTSTPRPLLVLPSPSPTLLVSSPRLMRLPLLLPTQTLQLLPPASMDTQGKKSVLLTTIKVAFFILCKANRMANINMDVFRLQQAE